MSSKYIPPLNEGQEAFFDMLNNRAMPSRGLGDGIDMEKIRQEIYDRGVPIKKGCMAAKQGGCFCTGACNEIIGYRKRLPGEL